jgi:hypothetical protein
MGSPALEVTRKSIDTSVEQCRGDGRLLADRNEPRAAMTQTARGVSAQPVTIS